MRLLVATHSLDWGGSARSLRILLRYLAPRHSICVVSLLPYDAQSPFVREYERLGLSLYHFPYGWLPVSYKACAVPEEEQDARCRAMQGQCETLRALARDADLFLCNGYPALSLAALIPQVPAVLLAREVLDKHSARFAEVCRYLQTYLHHAVAIGPHEAELLAALGIRHSVIYNTAEQRPQALSFPSARGVRFGYFGQLAASKGVVLLVEAMALAAANCRKAGAEMHIYGCHEVQPSPLESRLRAFVSANGLTDVILFHDWTEAVTEAMAAVHCVVRPDPTGSPWGRDIIEAMSLGRPVLAGGEEDVFVKPGKTGWLVRAGDAAALGAMLAVLSAKPRELEKAGQRAFAFAREHFDPVRTLPLLERALLTL